MSSNELTVQRETGVANNYDPEALKIFREAMENFTTRINRAPKKENIQTHQGYQYLPISFVEKKLDQMYFGLVQYECMSYQQIFNEMVCHARIKVFHPVALTWLNYDGIGSSVIQQDANTKVCDFNFNKKANAMQLASPKAYAEAIKNAAKKIGKIFGSDINRKFEDEYQPIVTKNRPTTEQKEEERITYLIQDAETVKDLLLFRNNVPESLQHLFNDKMTELEGLSNA